MLEQRDISDTLTAATANKWVNCPGSVELEQSFPDQSTRQLTEYGLLHEFASECLDSNKTASTIMFENRAYQVKGEEINFLSDALVEAVDDYVNYVKSFVIDEETILLVEHTVYYDHIVAGGKSKVDAIVIDAGVCHIIDLSIGKRPINANKNHQLLIDALGAIATIREAYQCDLFKLTSVQPLLRRRSSWEITRDELIGWGENIKNSVQSALSAQPHFSPSFIACGQCKARGLCKPLAKHCLNTMQLMKQQQENLIMSHINQLSPDEQSQLLDQLPLIQLWQESLEKAAIERLKEGREVPGYELAHAKPALSWTNPQAAANVMTKLGLTSREIYQPQVVSAKRVKSPDKVKNRLGEDFKALEKLIKTQQGEPSLISTKAKKQLMIQPDRSAYSDLRVIAVA